MRSSISIEVKAIPGSDIKEALSDCANLALRLSIPVTTTFNGITVFVGLNANVNKGVEKYYYLGEHPEKLQHISI